MPNKIAVITMVKNEADIIESFARHALAYADVLLVVDHKSTDDTRKILEALRQEGLAIKIDTFEKNGYFQSEVMSGLLYRAIEEENADIVVAADADEFLVLDDENAGVTALREKLQCLDTTKVHYMPWVDYALVDEEQGQELFLLARPCQRNAEKSDWPKVIVGKGAAKQYRITLSQGNHVALKSDGNTIVDLAVDGAQEGLHVAHFQWRSHAQRLSKALCGWLAHVEAFSWYTANGEHWQKAFRDFLETGQIPRQSLEHPLPADLSRYAKATTNNREVHLGGTKALRYTKIKTDLDCLASVARFAENIAQTCCQQRTIANGRLVSVLVIFDGNLEALEAALRSVAAQTYPHFEVLVLSFGGKEDARLQKAAVQWESRHPQPLQVIYAPFFRELAEKAQGDFVQWILPGDLLFPEKILSMLMLMANDNESFSQFIISEAVAREKMAFSPPLLKINEPTKKCGGIAYGEFQQYLIRSGVKVLCGLSGVLFRREVMERAGWLENCFVDRRFMELSAWVSIWEAMPEGSCRSMMFFQETLVEVEPHGTADDFILYEMEWRYLMERWRGTPLLPEESYQEAIKKFAKERNRRQTDGNLRLHASPELYEAYMEA